MKGMKGRILRKLKSIPQVGYLKQGRVLHVSAADGFVDDGPPPPDSGRVLRDLPTGREAKPQPELSDPRCAPLQPEIIDVSELMRDLEDDDDDEEPDKENTRPASPPRRIKNPKEDTTTQPGLPRFRRPDLDSETLFDPELLSAFERAVLDHIRSYDEAARSRFRAPKEEEDDPDGSDEGPPSKVPRTNHEAEEGRGSDPLSEFEERCPPGGSGAVILYTTTLRGIRKTFEDCNGVRLLLENLRVAFYERDVSMHMEFREELWSVLGFRAIPPRLFVKGRYLGGADLVLGLHEQGRLLPLLRGLPRDRRAGGAPCGGCAGMRFVVCPRCCGSRRLHDDESPTPIPCPQCNENGLMVCPVCC